MSDNRMHGMEEVFGLTPLEKEEEQDQKNVLPEFKDLDPAEQLKKINKLFREVFNTHNGKIVLGIILEDLYYFDNCSNDEARALNNYAKTLISQRLGFNDHNTRVDNLFNV